MFCLRTHMLGECGCGGKAQPWASFYSWVINLVYNRNWQTLKYDIEVLIHISVCGKNVPMHVIFPYSLIFGYQKEKGFWWSCSPRLFLLTLFICQNTFLPALVFWLGSRNVVKIRKAIGALLSISTSSKITCVSTWCWLLQRKHCSQTGMVSLYEPAITFN